ncbi:signal peptidase I [Streptomyces sp. CC210A]|uniref:signal peptidase I n=1 Tax=Streptomyces sp. CC210A TaxID=2898184 RepID=UPI0022A86F62|nr:signal peptidase I [Streptomyces sp. CC210A]
MDTEAQHPERDLSSDADTRTEGRSRFVRSRRPRRGGAATSTEAPSVTGGPATASDPAAPESSPSASAGPEPAASGSAGSGSAAATETEAPGPQQRGTGWLGELSWRRTGAIGLVCALGVLLLGQLVIPPYQIPSRSMEPTLQVGDRVLVNRFAYRFGSLPERGDVVVFDGTGSFVRNVPEENAVVGLLHGTAAALGLAEPSDTVFVKRVIGVGGDRVTCCDKEGRVEVNGTAVDEPYLHPADTASRVPFDIVVRPGTLWVMGDHRSQSRDSREHLGAPGGGTVPVERVIGRADWIGWPAGRWSVVGLTGAFDAVPALPHGSPAGGAHG